MRNFRPMKRQRITNPLFYWSRLVEKFTEKFTPPLATHPSSKNADSGDSVAPKDNFAGSLLNSKCCCLKFYSTYTNPKFGTECSKSFVVYFVPLQYNTLAASPLASSGFAAIGCFRASPYGGIYILKNFRK